MFNKEKKGLTTFEIFVLIVFFPLIATIWIIKYINKIIKKRNEKFTPEFTTWEKLVYGNNAKKFKEKQIRYEEYIKRKVDCTPKE